MWRCRALTLLLLLAGCTPPQWTRPDATPEQAKADAADCQQRAFREAQWYSFAYRPTNRYGRYPLWGDPFFDEARLARFCMEARGYELEAAEKR